MPGANQVFECPPSLKKFFPPIHLEKFLTTLFQSFLHFSQFYKSFSDVFTYHLQKFLTTFFLLIYTHLCLHFLISFWMPPHPGCPGPSLFFSEFLSIYP